MGVSHIGKEMPVLSYVTKSPKYMQQCYISNARLNDAPQVRISSSPMCPWMSLESCREWCEKNCFSFIIKKLTPNSPRVDDETLYNSDKRPVVGD